MCSLVVMFVCFYGSAPRSVAGSIVSRSCSCVPNNEWMNEWICIFIYCQLNNKSSKVIIVFRDNVSLILVSWEVLDGFSPNLQYWCILRQIWIRQIMRSKRSKFKVMRKQNMAETAVQGRYIQYILSVLNHVESFSCSVVRKLVDVDYVWYMEIFRWFTLIIAIRCLGEKSTRSCYILVYVIFESTVW